MFIDKHLLTYVIACALHSKLANKTTQEVTYTTVPQDVTDFGFAIGKREFTVTIDDIEFSDTVFEVQVSFLGKEGKTKIVKSKLRFGAPSLSSLNVDLQWNNEIDSVQVEKLMAPFATAESRFYEGEFGDAHALFRQEYREALAQCLPNALEGLKFTIGQLEEDLVPKIKDKCNTHYFSYKSWLDWFCK